MKNPQIKNPSNWPAIEAALAALSEGAPLTPSLFATIADRLRSAIEAPDAARIEEAATRLETFFRQAVAMAPAALQAATRGEDAGQLAAGYALGKLSFAQLLAARIADTRTDTRFIEHVRDTRYLPFLQAMFVEPLSVTALAEKGGSRIETVSRKLSALRALGIVASRKQGTVVVNMLTPAASATLEALGLAPTQEQAVPTVRDVDIRQALDERREELAPHMQATPLFSHRRAAAPRQAA